MATLAGSFNGLAFGPGTDYHVSGVEGLWDADGVEDRDLPRIGNGSFVGRDRQGGRRLILTLTLIADTAAAYDTLVSDLIDATEPGAGDNLLTANTSSIETSDAGWGNTANTNLARSTALARAGSASLAMSPAVTGDTAVFSAPIRGVSVVPGRTYTVMGSISPHTGTGRASELRIRTFDAANNLVAEPLLASVTTTTNTWADLISTYKIPNGAVKADVTVYVRAAAETHYLDKVSLHQGKNTAWTEGGKFMRIERPLRLMGNTVYVNARPRRRIIPIATDRQQRSGEATIEFFASNPAVYTGAP